MRLWHRRPCGRPFALSSVCAVTGRCAVYFSPTWRSQSGTDKIQVPVPCPLCSVVDRPAATAPVPVPRTCSLRPFPPSFPSPSSRIFSSASSQSVVRFLNLPTPSNPFLPHSLVFSHPFPALRQTLPTSHFRSRTATTTSSRPLNDGSSLGHEPADPKQARTARVVPAATTRPCPPDFVHKRSFEVTSRDPRRHRPFHDAPFFDIRGPALFDARPIFPRVQFSLASIRSALGFKRPSDGLRAHRSTSTNDLN